MAQTIKLRRSAVAGNRPTTAQLDLGELAINTVDGKIYFEKSGSNGESIQEIFTTNASNSGSLTTIGNVTITGSLLMRGDTIQTGSLVVSANNIPASIESIQTVYNVSANGASNYVIDGNSNPTLTLVRGVTYTINVNASGHPFWIKTAPTTGTGDQYNDGVTNNGTQSGTITFVVANNAPSTLYYICQFHSGMVGTINIVDNIYTTGEIKFIGATSVTGSLKVSGSLNISNEISSSTINGIGNVSLYSQSVDSRLDLVEATASYLNTTFSTSVDSRLDVIETTYATTGSNQFYGNQTVNGNLTITGTLVAQQIETQLTTSFVAYESGSTKFGDSADDIHSFTGSVKISGSLNSTSSITAAAGFFGDLTGTASFATSASLANTASFSLSSARANEVIIKARNGNNSTLVAGTVVRITSAVGDNPIFNTASWDNDGTSANTLGILSNSVASGVDGDIVVIGTVYGVNTDPSQGYAAGQIIYLSSSGQFTNIQPSAPQHIVTLGEVLRAQQNNGSIFVNISNGWELGELHNVKDTTDNSSYGQLLVKSGSLWKSTNQLTGSYSLTGSLYATNVLSASILQATQITGSLSGNADTATSASNVLYSNIGEKPTLVSGSVQIDVLQTTNIDKIAVTGSNTFKDNQIISGNLDVTGTITAKEYHVTLVSSSVLYTSGSTKFGDTGDDTHQFTGSVVVSGSLSVTGSVSLRDSLTVGGTLIATAISGSGAGLTDIGVTEKVFYVSEDGLDTNDGKTLSTSFRTIKAAITAASASLALNPGLPVYRQSVQVKSGYYVEEAPITVPSNVSILGDDLRSVVIRPTTGTKTENLFLMNNGTYCWGLRLEGCEIDDLDNPRKGFFFAFAPNAYIVTSPYIQNCSAISTPADKFYVPLDYENNNPLVGNGPGGMIIDDSVLNGYSPLKSMIVDAYTQVAFNGIGICIRGRGYGQLVSFFTNFSSTGVFCIDGGHASLLNSNTTFGDYGLRAEGKRMLVRPDITAVSASIDVSGSLLIKAEKANIQNYMINKLVLSGSYNSTYVSGSGNNYASTITDSGLLIDSIADDLLQVKATRTSQFTSGLFKGQDITTGSIYTLAPAISSSFDKGAITIFPLISNTSGSLAGDFILSYGYMKEYVLQDPDSRFTTMTTAAKNKIGQLFDVVSNTLTQVVVQNSGSNLLEEFGSLVTSTSHDFSYAGAGVNFLALPINQGGVGETNYDIRISEVSGGRVFHTSGDETGDFYAGNDFIIRQATGTIEGRTFTKALSAQFTPLNLALEN
jgi:hypothetical protein